MQLKTTIGILIYMGIATSVQVKSLPQKNAEQKPPATQTQQEDEIRPGEGEAKFDIFDWHLAKITGLTNTEVENVVTSPISLKLVLATLFDGANSTTAEEIARAMGFDKDNREYLRKSYNKVLKSLRTSSPHLISDVETRIFAHHTAALKKSFVDVLKSNYGTDIEKVDFSEVSKAIQKMNKWAEGVTHGHIKDLISEGDADKNAVMLLLNVIFFNGLWKLPFAENETKIEQFYLNDRQYVNAAMMKAQHSLDYVESFDFNIQIVRLPYRDGTFAMYIILPRSRSGINDLIANVTPERVHTLMRGMTPTNVELSIPKFDFSYSVGLKPVLRSLGIEQMFTTAADFSNMEENNSLYVSNVIQKAGIEINEKGSTAYASTVVEIHNKYGGSDEDKVRFNANRPFLFFIEEDKTRTVLFVGKMTNPSSDTPPAPALPPSFEGNKAAQLFNQTVLLNELRSNLNAASADAAHTNAPTQ
uniref:Serpin7 n=1 Tax=Laodelphax striatellus TaxID=195883 RepID=A0A7G5M2T4_LAOST|nr:serpin7 [Laodelphax striatellus]